MWKIRKEKSTERERFHYVNGDNKSVLWIQVNSPFPLEGVLYLYKSCQIDKAKESCSIWIPKSLIWLRIDPNTPVWIDVEESPSLSSCSCLATDKDELTLGVATLFELRLGLRIEISVIGYDSYVNHRACSQSKLDDGSELTIPEVTTLRTSTRGWIDMCHNLRRVRKWPLHMPLCSILLGRGRELFLGRFQVPGVSDLDRVA